MPTSLKRIIFGMRYLWGYVCLTLRRSPELGASVLDTWDTSRLLDLPDIAERLLVLLDNPGSFAVLGHSGPPRVLDLPDIPISFAGSWVLSTSGKLRCAWVGVANVVCVTRRLYSLRRLRRHSLGNAKLCSSLRERRRRYAVLRARCAARMYQRSV